MPPRDVPVNRRPRLLDAFVECCAAGAVLGAAGALIALTPWPVEVDLMWLVAAQFGFIIAVTGSVSAWRVGLTVARRLVRIGAGRGKVTVGNDGVSLDGTEHDGFIPYSEISNIRVERFRQNVVLELSGGEAIRFRVAGAKGVAATIAGQLELTKWNEAVHPIAALGDAGKDRAAWRTRVGQLRAGGFRDGAVTEERLAELAADPRADAEQRIGAALALHDAPPAVRMRVQAAADESARPELREALVRAVEGEVDEGLLTNALD